MVTYITAYTSSEGKALPPANVLPLSGFTYPPHTAPTATPAVPATQALGAGSILRGGDARAVGMPGSGGQCTGAWQEYHKAHHISSPFVSLSGMSDAALTRRGPNGGGISFGHETLRLHVATYCNLKCSMQQFPNRCDHKIIVSLPGMLKTWSSHPGHGVGLLLMLCLLQERADS